MESTVQTDSRLFEQESQQIQDSDLIRKAVQNGWNVPGEVKQLAVRRLGDILRAEHTKETVLVSAIKALATIDGHDLKLQIARQLGRTEFLRADVVNNITNINQSQTNVLNAQPGSLWNDIDRIKVELAQAQEAEQVDREIPQDLAYEREARRLAGLSQTSHAPVPGVPTVQLNDEIQGNLSAGSYSMQDRPETDEPAPTGYEPYSSSIGWGHDHREPAPPVIPPKPETPHLGNADGLPGQSNDDAGRAKRAVDPHRP